MFVVAYAIIVVLTCILVAMNVRSVVQQYVKDKNAIRLYSYLATLVIMGSLIIGVSSAIVQRVIDSETFLKLDNTTASRANRY
jgi:uncharacterized integral membrane protein